MIYGCVLVFGGALMVEGAAGVGSIWGEEGLSKICHEKSVFIG